MRNLLFLMALTCVTAGCQKNTDLKPEATAIKHEAPAFAASNDCLRRRPTTDVYVTGIALSQPSAVYLKNGILINLTPAGSDSEAFGIAVKGADVYVTGDAIINGQRQAVYWKNGVMHPLAYGHSTTFASEAFDITLDGNDVYIVGDYNDLVHNNQAMLWKNGRPHNLGYTPFGSGARAVKVKGCDVYVAGYSAVNDTVFYIATYWKNGVPHRLENGRGFSFVNGMAINDNDIYIAGETFPTSNDIQTVVYWKNGKKNKVQYNATANAITISNDNIYIAGTNVLDLNNQQFQAAYWKNGAATLLGGVGGGYFGRDIQVAGNDVYLLSEKPYGAILYKNGQGTSIDDINPSRLLVVRH